MSECRPDIETSRDAPPDSGRLDAKQADATDSVDRVGALASSLCAVHCMVCMLLPYAFGALGLGFLLGHEAEWTFTLIAVALALGALVMGWRRNRSIRVSLLLILGISGLLVSRGLEAAGEHDDHHEAQAPTARADHPDAEASSHKHAHSEEGSRSSLTGGFAPEIGHLAGSGLGVVGGILLLSGHLLNLRGRQRGDSSAS